MQYIQEITLDIHQHGYVSINAKQGDQNGRFIRIHLTNNGEEIKLVDGESVEFRALKPDGKSIDNPATIEDDGTILACLTDQTLAVDGEVIADIAIKQGSNVVSTLNFVIDVQKAPLGEDIPSTNEFGALTKATEDALSAANRANDAAGLIEGMTVSASKVAAGGTPTAKLTTDSDHYNLAFGLVTGDKGAKGDKGDTPTIEIAETVTGAPGDPAKVENVGTPTDPKLKFTIPLGNQGPVSSVNGGTGDVVIGGRNLYTGTKDFSGDRWKTNTQNDLKDFVIEEELYLGFTVLSKSNAWNFPYQIVQARTGDVFTLSLYARSDTDGLNIQFSGTGSKIHEAYLSTSWKRYSYSFAAKTDGDFSIAFDSRASGKVYICGYKLERGNVSTDWSLAPEDYLGPFNAYNIPNMHRNIFRGQSLGSTFTDAQKAAIAAGTWDDLYLGDYWTINNHTWRIADFDYWLGKGDTSCMKHHIVVVPEVSLYTAQMHNTDTGEYVAGTDNNSTAGGYALSDMRQSNLARAKTMIETDFGVGSILNHRIQVTNVVNNGYPSGVIWDDSEVDLMNECMVYGMPHFRPQGNGTIIPGNYTTEYTQLALFQLAPYYIQPNRSWYWLRDVVSAVAFASVGGSGGAGADASSDAGGVRPAVGIVGA